MTSATACPSGHWLPAASRWSHSPRGVPWAPTAARSAPRPFSRPKVWPSGPARARRRASAEPQLERRAAARATPNQVGRPGSGAVGHRAFREEPRHRPPVRRTGLRRSRPTLRSTSGSRRRQPPRCRRRPSPRRPPSTSETQCASPPVSAGMIAAAGTTRQDWASGFRPAAGSATMPPSTPHSPPIASSSVGGNDGERRGA